MSPGNFPACLETWEATEALIPQVSRQCWWLTTQSCVALKKLLSAKGDCLAKDYEPSQGVAHFQWLVVVSEPGQNHGPLDLIWDHLEGRAPHGKGWGPSCICIPSQPSLSLLFFSLPYNAIPESLAQCTICTQISPSESLVGVGGTKPEADTMLWYYY